MFHVLNIYAHLIDIPCPYTRTLSSSPAQDGLLTLSGLISSDWQGNTVVKSLLKEYSRLVRTLIGPLLSIMAA